MAAYTSTILYFFTKLSGNAINDLNVPQIEFLFDVVFPYTVYYDDNGIPHNFVLPSHLARDIRFSELDGNPVFNTWLSAKKLTTRVPLTYDNATPPIRTNNGVYPKLSDIQGWKHKFEEWGVSSWTTENNKNATTTFIVPNMSSENGDSIATEWMNTQKHPDNFLAWYGIYPDSPLAVSFINQDYNDPITGLKLDPQAFSNLCGQGSLANPGGWLGYVTGLSGAEKRDDYINFLYSKYAVQATTQSREKSEICNPDTLKGITSAITASVGLLAMLAMPGIGWIGAAVIFGLALTTGGIAYYNATTTPSTCKSS